KGCATRAAGGSRAGRRSVPPFAAALLLLTLLLLGLDPALLRGAARLGRDPRLGSLERLAQQRRELLARALAVAVLVAVGLAGHHHLTRLGEDARRELGPQAGLLPVGEGGARGEVEAQLDLRAGHVDVLPARAARARRAHAQLARRQHQPGADLEVV